MDNNGINNQEAEEDLIMAKWELLYKLIISKTVEDGMRLTSTGGTKDVTYIKRLVRRYLPPIPDATRWIYKAMDGYLRGIQRDTLTVNWDPSHKTPQRGTTGIVFASRRVTAGSIAHVPFWGEVNPRNLGNKGGSVDLSQMGIVEVRLSESQLNLKDRDCQILDYKVMQFISFQDFPKYFKPIHDFGLPNEFVPFQGKRLNNFQCRGCHHAMHEINLNNNHANSLGSYYYYIKANCGSWYCVLSTNGQNQHEATCARVTREKARALGLK